MTVVTEPHPDGWGHRWLLLDRTTGEILCTGTEAYSTPEHAEVIGARQLPRRPHPPDTRHPGDAMTRPHTILAALAGAIAGAAALIAAGIPTRTGTLTYSRYELGGSA